MNVARVEVEKMERKDECNQGGGGRDEGDG